jgi:hypothetical protein
MYSFSFWQRVSPSFKHTWRVVLTKSKQGRRLGADTEASYPAREASLLSPDYQTIALVGGVASYYPSVHLMLVGCMTALVVKGGRESG